MTPSAEGESTAAATATVEVKETMPMRMQLDALLRLTTVSVFRKRLGVNGQLQLTTEFGQPAPPIIRFPFLCQEHPTRGIQ